MPSTWNEEKEKKFKKFMTRAIIFGLILPLLTLIGLLLGWFFSKSLEVIWEAVFTLVGALIGFIIGTVILLQYVKKMSIE